MSLDLGTAFVRSRRAVCLAALAPMLASAPVAAQVPTTPTAPTQTPAGTTQTPPPPPSQLPADPNIIRGLEVHAGVGIDEVFTDNARGVASGGQLTVQANNTVTTTPQAKVSDLVTRVTPLLSIVDRTARLEGGLTFQPSFQAYALATDLDRFDNSLLGTASAELWREHFFVESSVSMSSEIINTQGAITTSATNISNNRADLNSYILTPIYKQAFGTFAIGELRYRIGETSSGAIAPSTNNAVTAMLKNGADVDRLAWTFRLEDSHTDQGNTSNAGQIVNNVAVPVATNSTSRRSGTIDATYAVTRIFSVLGGFGYEEVKNGSLTQIPKGPIGDFGIGLTGVRSELHVKMNFRYGTQYMSLDGRYELGPQLRLTASYDQSVTTTQEQVLDDLSALRLAPNGGLVSGPNGQPFVPINSQFGINSGIGNAAFRDRAALVGLNGAFGRNAYTMTILDERRRTESTGFDESSVGVTAGWARELNPVTKLNLNLAYTVTQDRGAVASTDNTYNVTTGLTYQLNNSLTATASYSFIYRRSNQPGQDVRENSLLLGIRKTI